MGDINLVGLKPNSNKTKLELILSSHNTKRELPQKKMKIWMSSLLTLASLTISSKFVKVKSKPLRQCLHVLQEDTLTNYVDGRFEPPARK